MLLSWHFFGVVSGRLGDFIGIRKCSAISIPIFVVGLVCAGVSTKLWQVVLFQGVVVGVAGSMAAFPGLALTPQWFNKRRALAGSVAVLGSGVGNFVYPQVINTHCLPLSTPHHYHATLSLPRSSLVSSTVRAYNIHCSPLQAFRQF
jgi:MFS family permease